MANLSSNNGGFWPTMRDNSMFATVLLIVFILLGTLFAALTLKTLIEVETIGSPEMMERSITVEGNSSAVAAPDIATISVSVESEGDTVEEAQDHNSRTIDAITDQLKSLGIAAADIQTSYYNVYEDEIYNPQTFNYEPIGWIVYQDLEVTVRDITLVSDVLDVAGRSGATDIYGPNYAIDDTTLTSQAARTKAIADARKNAEQIAAALGVRIGDVIDYDEWSSTPYYDDPYYYDYGEIAETAAIEPGTEEVSLNVTITFELIQ